MVDESGREPTKGLARHPQMGAAARLDSEEVVREGAGRLEEIALQRLVADVEGVVADEFE